MIWSEYKKILKNKNAGSNRRLETDVLVSHLILFKQSSQALRICDLNIDEDENFRYIKIHLNKRKKRQKQNLSFSSLRLLFCLHFGGPIKGFFSTKVLPMLGLKRQPQYTPQELAAMWDDDDGL